MIKKGMIPDNELTRFVGVILGAGKKPAVKVFSWLFRQAKKGDRS